MRLSDYKGEEALDVLADIIEPLANIITDEEIQEMAKKDNTPVLAMVKPAIKNHKRDLIEILARLENKTVEEYEKTMNLLTLPKQVMELLNDSEVQSLFQSQGKSEITSLASSSSAMETTEASAE